jgi:hypothetical protein
MLVTCLASLCASDVFAGDAQTITDRMHHLRSTDGPHEWSEFPDKAEGTRLELKFDAAVNDTPYCLELRQQDIKQTWRIKLNDADLGQLHRDENDMVVYFDVPTGALKAGANVLTIEASRARSPDDIRVGEIALHDTPQAELLKESYILIKTLNQTPVRITIVNERGALQQTGLKSNRDLAVRPGIVYTNQRTGPALIPVPAGKYTVYVGRGFEFALGKVETTTRAGSVSDHSVFVRREVPTEGYVACDTHVHTRTHSGHGDSTVQERMITLAAEGIELPIATDHNVHIDHRPFAREAGVEKFFTPVIGNEVTTPVGHFNIWPVTPGSPPPAYKLDNWADINTSISKVPGVKAVILNHSRDVHSGVRPFGPKLFNDAVGERVDGSRLPANAMEVVNSGANQTDIMQLFHDWMALLNRGLNVTPVGSSDSHDVARHFVGQGRTYIRCDDSDPGNIDVDEAASNFALGRVMVSYGLLAELTVEGAAGADGERRKYQSGDLASVDGEKVRVHVRVLGPRWTQASHVWLFSNGERIREIELTGLEEERKRKPGVLWEDHWEINRPSHDVHLVAIAVGPGIEGSYWRTAKPYQPTSPEWTPTSIGCSGAIWIDGDGDGKRSSAHAYAQHLHEQSRGDLRKLLSLLDDYDSAVSAQAAHLYRVSNSAITPKLDSIEAEQAIAKSDEHVRRGIRRYKDAWRKNQIAAAEH